MERHNKDITDWQRPAAVTDLHVQVATSDINHYHRHAATAAVKDTSSSAVAKIPRAMLHNS